jgi:hypothetical protein
MATQLLFYNDAFTNLAGSISNIAVTANLTPGGGALFIPPPGINQGFKGTFIDAATGLLNEIVLVTNVTGDTITMVRAQEGTTALTWNAGDLFQNLLTAGTMGQFIQSIQFSPARIVYTSGATPVTIADSAIGLYRASSPATSTVVLPPNAINGYSLTIDDLYGNFQQYPVTVSAPTTSPAQTIANQNSITLNVNRQSVTFRFYTDGTLAAWSPEGWSI